MSQSSQRTVHGLSYNYHLFLDPWLYWLSMLHRHRSWKNHIVLGFGWYFFQDYMERPIMGAKNWEIFSRCTLNWKHLFGSWPANQAAADDHGFCNRFLRVGENDDYIGGLTSFFDIFRWVHEDQGFILFFLIFLHSS